MAGAKPWHPERGSGGVGEHGLAGATPWHPDGPWHPKWGTRPAGLRVVGAWRGARIGVCEIAASGTLA